MTKNEQDKVDIAARCREAGGLVEVDLGALRDALGYRKLGTRVLVEVADSLGEKRLGFFPTYVLDPRLNAAPRQSQTVWVYDKDGGHRAQVIDAVLHPQQHDVQAILSSLSNIDALSPEQRLNRIRDLVG